MFTGIVKEVGRIEKSVRKSAGLEISVRSQEVYKDAEISDSIAINGVCLTVTAKTKDLLFFDAISPTLKNTNLKKLKRGDYINLEPALKLGEKVGGHFVLGHVDAECKLRKVSSFSGTQSVKQLEIELPREFKSFIVEKGSVAIEGISLTVKKVTAASFTVDIIPFTYNHTSLKYRRVGELLNIEFDYLLKKKT